MTVFLSYLRSCYFPVIFTWTRLFPAYLMLKPGRPNPITFPLLYGLKTRQTERLRKLKPRLPAIQLALNRGIERHNSIRQRPHINSPTTRQRELDIYFLTPFAYANFALHTMQRELVILLVMSYYLTHGRRE